MQSGHRVAGLCHTEMVSSEGTFNCVVPLITKIDYFQEKNQGVGRRSFRAGAQSFVLFNVDQSNLKLDPLIRSLRPLRKV